MGLFGRLFKHESETSSYAMISVKISKEGNTYTIDFTGNSTSYHRISSLEKALQKMTPYIKKIETGVFSLENKDFLFLRLENGDIIGRNSREAIDYFIAENCLKVTERVFTYKKRS